MTTSEITSATSSTTARIDSDIYRSPCPTSSANPLSAIQNEYLIKGGSRLGSLLGHSSDIVDTLPDLLELGRVAKRDLAGKDPAGRETMKTIAGATSKGITASAITAGTVAAIGAACTALVTPAAVVAVPIIAAAGAAALYFAPSYADSAARATIDKLGDGAQAAGRWLKSLL